MIRMLCEHPLRTQVLSPLGYNEKLKLNLFAKNMRIFFYYISIFISLTLCFGCSLEESKKDAALRNQKGEYIYRNHDEVLYVMRAPQRKNQKVYPWEQDRLGKHPKITKEFFRCKGNVLNTPRIEQDKDLKKVFDCGGKEKHSLPLRDGKEFIYPILIELLNFIQIEMGKKVVITSGHRCPEHHIYADPSRENQSSKHMIGAEVSFYVQGIEEKPELVIGCILKYYRQNAIYRDLPEFIEFKRYDKSDVHVSTLPWYNKEIFIKLYKKNEGRNFDNRHPYPYISIQVRYDRDLNEKVVYSWAKANRGYHRW